MATGIQWTDETWNPIAAFDRETGKRGWYCAHVSPGCLNCYAESMNRFRGNGLGYSAQNAKHVDCRIVEKLLVKPLSWRKPRKVFVCSMTDLFLEQHTDEMIDRAFAVMALADRHTFQVLTKRPDRMLGYMSAPNLRARIADQANALMRGRSNDTLMEHALSHRFLWRSIENAVPGEWSNRLSGIAMDQWPLPNVWLGVTVEDQRRANERIPVLLDTPAAIRFLSCEPLLGPADLTRVVRQQHIDGLAVGDVHDSLGGWVCDSRGEPIACAPEMERIDWVIVGGESGRGARAFDLAWARDVVAQCAKAEVPCFVKQMGANPVDPWADTGALVLGREPAKPEFKHSHGGDIAEWPSDLRVREFPAAVTV